MTARRLPLHRLVILRPPARRRWLWSRLFWLALWALVIGFGVVVLAAPAIWRTL